MPAKPSSFIQIVPSLHYLWFLLFVCMLDCSKKILVCMRWLIVRNHYGYWIPWIFYFVKFVFTHLKLLSLVCPRL